MCFKDIIRFSAYMAWIEIRNNFRRTYLGTLWNTLGIVIFVVLLGTFFGAILKKNLMGFDTYIPFLSAGILVWSFLSSSINESSSIFATKAQTFRYSDYPFIVIPLSISIKNLFVFIQNIFVFYIIFAIFFDIPAIKPVSLILSILLISFNIIWLSVLSAISCIRFRDLPQFISGILYIGFLLTPILWTEQFLGRYQYLLEFNPLHHLVNVVRNPLLGTAPSLKTWGFVFGILLIGSVFTVFVYRHNKNKIPYWL